MCYQMLPPPEGKPSRSFLGHVDLPVATRWRHSLRKGAVGASVPPGPVQASLLCPLTYVGAVLEEAPDVVGEGSIFTLSEETGGGEREKPLQTLACPLGQICLQPSLSLLLT